MIDFTTAGKYTVQAKINSLEPLGQSGKIDLVGLDGIPRKIKCWKSSSSKFGTALEVGAEAEAVVEVKLETRKDTGETSLEAYLVSFGGLKASESTRKPSFQPKTPEEIHGPSISGLIKSSIETRGDAWQETATAAIKLYFQSIKHVQEGPNG